MSPFGAENNLKLQFLSYDFIFFCGNKPSHQFCAPLFPFLWRYLQTFFSLSKLFSMSVRLRLTLFFSVSAPFVILQPAHYHKMRHSFLSHPFQKPFHYLLPCPFSIQGSIQLWRLGRGMQWTVHCCVPDVGSVSVHWSRNSSGDGWEVLWVPRSALTSLSPGHRAGRAEVHPAILPALRPAFPLPWSKAPAHAAGKLLSSW